MKNERVRLAWNELHNLLPRGYFRILIIFVLAFAVFPKAMGAPFDSYLPTYFTLLFTIFTVLFGIEWGSFDSFVIKTHEAKMAADKAKGKEAKNLQKWAEDLKGLETAHRARRDLYLFLAIIFLLLVVLSTTFDVDVFLSNVLNFIWQTTKTLLLLFPLVWLIN